MMSIVLMGLSIVVFIFAGRMHRGGDAGKSRLLLVLAVALAALALLAALNVQMRATAPAAPPATAPAR